MKAAAHPPSSGALRLGVVIVEPVSVIRAGLALLVRSHADMEILGQAASVEQGLQIIRGIRRRTRLVVLVSLSLTGEHDAFWLIRAIRDRSPTSVILGCGANAARMSISRALFVGADGFLDQTADPDRFVEAMRRAAGGEVVLEGVSDQEIGTIAERIELHRDAGTTLTDREIEVLTVAAEGLTAKEIGIRLGMSERTVTTHLGHIYWKLGVAGRVEALTVAARSGLVSVGWLN